jgi:hypothetical protein
MHAQSLFLKEVQFSFKSTKKAFLNEKHIKRKREIKFV